ncbi:MAG: hypothetical protein ABS911_07490, partial [Carnobacterium sp.]
MINYLLNAFNRVLNLLLFNSTILIVFIYLTIKKQHSQLCIRYECCFDYYFVNASVNCGTTCFLRETTPFNNARL